MNGTSARLSRHALVFLAFVALSVVMTWPLAAHMATHVVSVKWHYDSMVNMMILGSRMHWAMGIGLENVYDNYFCAPVPFSIANNENLFGLTLLYAPFYLLTRDPLLSYNLLLLLCLSLSGFFTYLFILRRTGSALGGVLVGVGFAYCPYVVFELGRLQLVATQWIPLCALFLHESIERPRVTSMLALGLAYAMQIGSCLYYAMYLVVYFAVVGAWLLVAHKPAPWALLRRGALAAMLPVVLIAGMAYPYARSRAELQPPRTPGISMSYSGKVEYLTKVSTENKTLTFLRDPAGGPVEPIAFPGFTLSLLALLAVVAPLLHRYRTSVSGRTRRGVLTGVALGALGLALGLAASVAFGTFLAGIPALAMPLLWWRWIRDEPILPPEIVPYLWLLLLVFLLFLGPKPITWTEPATLGLYHYLYEYVPGFDGMRYVSRFAVLVMFALAVLAGHGASALLRGLASGRTRLVFVLMLVALLLELRIAPVALAQLPNRSHLPPAYQWLAQHPGPEPLAAIPAYTKGFFGARENYMSLFHHRRTVNGKSTWMPPMTHMYINEARRFPRESLRDLLHTLGVRFLLVHTSEYKSERAAQITDWLAQHADAYTLRFAGGGDRVYEVVRPPGEVSALLPTPPLPSGARSVTPNEMVAFASRESGATGYALDRNPATAWTTQRNQHPGDWFDLDLRRDRNVVAIEFSDFTEAFDAPLSFKLSLTNAEGVSRTVLERPNLRIYADQVIRPRTFVFRVVLPRPMPARRIRVELMDTVAGRWWSVHEASVWVKE